MCPPVLPVVLNACETWSLTLTEEHRLKVSESREQRKVCGSERNEVTGDWRRLHNEELHDLFPLPSYYSGVEIKKNEMGGACSTYGEGRRHAEFWWGKLKVEHHLGDLVIYGKQ
jgi:hypothetical protein